jgi:hypothetical protein
MFRRIALYGFDPPQPENFAEKIDSETEALRPTDFDNELDVNLLPKRFGNSTMLQSSMEDLPVLSESHVSHLMLLQLPKRSPLFLVGTPCIWIHAKLPM